MSSKKSSKLGFYIIILILFSLTCIFRSSLANQAVNSYVSFFKVFCIVSQLILLSVFFSVLSYNTFWNKDSSTLKVTSIILGTFFMACLSVYGYSVFSRTISFYDYLKKPRSGIDGQVYVKDSLLGYRPIPNSKGFHTYEVGDIKIPTQYDSNGFRVPLSKLTAVKERPLILFFGCSFTYGDACLAEKTYPYFVRDSLKINVINAAVCGYGLSQMYVLAEKLIPKYKPDVVVFQYSNWLTERALAKYAPTYFGVLPTPYIYPTSATEHKIAPPPFPWNDTNWNQYSHTPKSTSEFLGFANKALKMLVYEDIMPIVTNWRIQRHKMPAPEGNPLKAEQFVYQNVYKICQENNAKMVVLNLGNIQESGKSHHFFEANQHPFFVEAETALWNNLFIKTQDDYARKYGHWRKRGSDSVYVDRHPNSTAHKVISDALINVLKTEVLPKPQSSSSSKNIW